MSEVELAETGWIWELAQCEIESVGLNDSSVVITGLPVNFMKNSCLA